MASRELPGSPRAGQAFEGESPLGRGARLGHESLLGHESPLGREAALGRELPPDHELPPCSSAVPKADRRFRLGRLLLGGTLSLLVLALLGVLAAGLLRVQSPLVRERRPAPDFTLTTFDGQPLRSAELRGRPVVLNFWASWCAPCRDEAPVLERAWRRYGRQGVAFVGVDVQEEPGPALAFIRERGLTYALAPDDGHVSIDYGLAGVPETLFITADGTIVRRYAGPVDDALLSGLIEPLLADGASPMDQQGQGRAAPPAESTPPRGT